MFERCDVVQEVDRVVARVRARENEQHDVLGPVQTFVNAHMQASSLHYMFCKTCPAMRKLVQTPGQLLVSIEVMTLCL